MNATIANIEYLPGGDAMEAHFSQLIAHIHTLSDGVHIFEA